MNDLAKVSNPLGTGLANLKPQQIFVAFPLAFLPKLLASPAPASPSPLSVRSATQSPTRPSLLCKPGELQSPC